LFKKGEKKLILKDRGYPIVLLNLETLIRRISRTHPKLSTIQGDYNKRVAGYWGEKRLDEIIDGIPDLPFIILRDLCLTIKGVHFQIDTLLLSPFFILIIESKNISGNLLFDTSYNQLIRTNQENKEEAFEDPILQAQNQKRNLSNWFKEQKISQLPIETLVAMSNSSAVIRSTSGNEILSKYVVPVKKIPHRLEQLLVSYKKKLTTERKIMNMAHLLIEHHQPVEINLLKKYGISTNEILSGVLCPKCSSIPMDYQKGKWICRSCCTESKDAHFQAVDDYLLLVKNTITNKEFRDFIRVPSMKLASKLLSTMNLPTGGAKKNRYYYK
jgi:hypothetical protein